MTFALTPEQSAIISFAKLRPESLLITALAGAAKTTTLVLAAHELPLVPTFCGAFNKSIAEEMKKRMPSHIEVSTMNSVGHRVWGRKVTKKLILNKDKGYEILSAQGERKVGEEKSRFGESFASLLRAVRLAKSAGFVPPRFHSMGRSLIDVPALIELIGPQVDVEPDEYFLSNLERALESSIAQSFEGVIDFDDQIYMSTLFGGQYPKYDILMIDEAQDLSPLNHETLKLMFKSRLIAVGDPHQAIYGFRGAHTSSMSALAEAFAMEELPLSISFRCPKEVVRRQQAFVPSMRYPDWAAEGEVERLTAWETDSIPDGAAIICRNNAPLLSCALKLIKARRSVRLRKSDIGKGLITIMKKLGDGRTPQAEAIDALKRWRSDSLAKAHDSRKASIIDRADCILVFLDDSPTLSEAIAFAEHLFAAQGKIELMTGHGAKGLEFPIVYHLDSFRIPSIFAKRSAEAGDDTQLSQENNLRYVIETRSMDKLFIADLEDLK